MTDTNAGRKPLGKLKAIGGQWDENGNAILYVTTEQPYIGMKQLEALQGILDAGVAPAPQAQRENNGWVKVKTIDDLPKKPGKMSYEQIGCMVLRDGNYEHLVWNCEHDVWDDRNGDDFECAPLDVQAYFIIPEIPPAPTGDAK